MSKLTPSQITEIKTLCAKGIGATELARRFGVSTTAIYNHTNEAVRICIRKYQKKWNKKNRKLINNREAIRRNKLKAEGRCPSCGQLKPKQRERTEGKKV